MVVTFICPRCGFIITGEKSVIDPIAIEHFKGCGKKTRRKRRVNG